MEVVVVVVEVLLLFLLQVVFPILEPYLQTETPEIAEHKEEVILLVVVEVEVEVGDQFGLVPQPLLKEQHKLMAVEVVEVEEPRVLRLQVLAVEVEVETVMVKQLAVEPEEQVLEQQEELEVVVAEPQITDLLVVTVAELEELNVIARLVLDVLLLMPQLAPRPRPWITANLATLPFIWAPPTQFLPTLLNIM